MSANKTVPTKASVREFIGAIEHPQRKADSEVLLKMMRGLTRKRATMWGDSIVGFGRYHYRYDSGREGDFLVTGFSPRKQNLAVYIIPGFDSFANILEKLGKHKTGSSCLYINKLDDVDLSILEQLVRASIEEMKERYDCQI